MVLYGHDAKEHEILCYIKVKVYISKGYHVMTNA